MVKIEIKPIDIAGLKLYQKKSPAKFMDKFGDLDLDNIPKEYMRVHKVQVSETEWKDEEYFDSIQYRKDILAPKPKTPVDISLVPPPNAPVYTPAPAPTPDFSPANIGGDFVVTATDEIPANIDLDGNDLATKRT